MLETMSKTNQTHKGYDFQAPIGPLDKLAQPKRLPHPPLETQPQPEPHETRPSLEQQLTRDQQIIELLSRNVTRELDRTPGSTKWVDPALVEVKTLSHIPDILNQIDYLSTKAKAIQIATTPLQADLTKICLELDRSQSPEQAVELVRQFHENRTTLMALTDQLRQIALLSQLSRERYQTLKLSQLGFDSLEKYQEKIHSDEQLLDQEHRLKMTIL